MQAMQSELEGLKQKYKDDAAEQNKQIMALYKKYKVNPLSLILSIFIQIPIFIALYYAFFHTKLPEINTSLLYPFVHAPAMVNLEFLGFINLANANNILLALVVAGLQFAVVRLTLSRSSKHAPQNLSDEKKAMMKMQQNISLYTLPAIIAVVAYTTPAAVGLYFAAGSVFSLLQEWPIRRKIAREMAQKA